MDIRLRTIAGKLAKAIVTHWSRETFKLRKDEGNVHIHPNDRMINSIYYAIVSFVKQKKELYEVVDIVIHAALGACKWYHPKADEKHNELKARVHSILFLEIVRTNERYHDDTIPEIHRELMG